MKVLILGGTGAIGANLVRILSDNNVQTLVTSRSHYDNHHTISYVCGNAKDDAFLKKLCTQKWDAIVDFMSYKTNEFSARLDLLLSCTKQYVYISSSRVYADKEHPIKESSQRLLDVISDAAYLATDEYALTKARQEDLLINSVSKNYTIIRPYITYDKNRLQLGVLEKEEWLESSVELEARIPGSSVPAPRKREERGSLDPDSGNRGWAAQPGGEASRW